MEALARVGVIVAALLVGVSFRPAPVPADIAPFAADGLLSDAAFLDTHAATVTLLDAFLRAPPHRVRSLLSTYDAEDGRPASEVIVREAARAGLNPLVLLAKLQVEQSLVSRRDASPRAFAFALGCGCPDGRKCAEKTRGFAAQVRCAADKLNVTMNTPDESIFKYRDVEPGDFVKRDSSKPFVIMYHGSIVERHGLDLAVQALEIVRKTVPNAVLRIYGGNTPFLEEVMATVGARGLQGAVQSLGSKTLEQIAAAIDECDVGVIPNRRSIFTELNTPTRIFEYLARGKAVIAPDSGGITDYFGKGDLVLFKLGDAGDLARAMLFVHSQPAQAGEIVKRGQTIYRAHRWVQERDVLVNLVTKLAGGGQERGVHAASAPKRAAAVE